MASLTRFVVATRNSRVSTRPVVLAANKDVSHSKQQYLLRLLKEFCHAPISSTLDRRTSRKNGFERADQDALRYLRSQGLLECTIPSWAEWICPVLITLHPPLQIRLFHVTAKGKSTITRFEASLSEERALVSQQLTECFQKLDMVGALNRLREYRKKYSQYILDVHAPSKTHQLAAKIILTHSARLSKSLQISSSNLKPLQFQAAELLLTGTVLVDRLAQTDTAVHPKGHEWLVDKLCKYGVTHAQTLLENKEKRHLKSHHDTSIEGHTANILPVNAVTQFESLIPEIRMPMRVKITVPYVFLALVFALVGAYLISQVVLESLEERFTNQLIEVGKLSADRMVMEEDARLNTLRLIANTAGVADALIAEDAERLRQLALPYAVNAQEEAIEFINLQGVSVLSLRHHPDDRNEEYVSTRGDAHFGEWDIVRKVALGIVDNDGDKYSTIIAAPWGNYFYVAGPVITSDGRRVGVILVGRTLQTLANEFREQTLAQTTFYNLEGIPLTSTLLANKEKLPILDTQYVSSILNNQPSSSLMRDLSIASIAYTEIVGTWSVRGSTHVGMIGVSLPHTFLARPSEVTRIQIFVLVAVGLMLVIGIGLYLSRRITQPLLQVVNASAQVAQGNLDVSVQPVGNDEVAVLAHAFNHMMVGLRDATERRLREIQLMKALEHERELRELKSRFVSMVSHEFRTPLATILSSTEYIKTFGHEVPYPKRQKHFNRIEGAVSNMTRLLEEVLIIGKDESGRLEFNPSVINIEQFCKELTDEIQTTARDRHTIILHQQGTDVHLLLDEKLLRVALTNLLTNAIKYSPNSGNVYFDLICERDTVLFRVRDTGIGIPEKDQQRLFETFHRASNVSNISGTGLGLYITKMVVELHDGIINFESQVNAGTTFTIIIPARRGIEATA